MLALLVVVAAVIWLLVAQPWKGWGEAGAAPGASTSPSASSGDPTPSSGPEASVAPTLPVPEATSEDSAVVPCTSDEVRVEALTDKTEYAAGENPQLSLRLTNTSGVPCTMNVGTTGQQFTITSGSDVWWRSTDCQQDPSDMPITLAAGQIVDSAAPLVWDRTRSSVSTCGGSRPAAPGGGAAYHLDVAIGGFGSIESKQFFLR